MAAGADALGTAVHAKSQAMMPPSSALSSRRPRGSRTESQQKAAGSPEHVMDIVQRLREVAAQHQRVSIDDMVEAFGARSYGPFLIVPALLEITPIGAVPGVPTFLAALIVLFALQIVGGRRRFWIPSWLSKRSVSAERLCGAMDKMEPVARWMDRWFGSRWRALTRGPFVRLAALGCIALACTVPMAELVPFLSSGPMLAIALFGLALLVRDGLLMVVATVATGLALGLVVAIAR